MATRVVHDAEGARYEIWAGDELAGFTRYRPREGSVEFLHTQVDDGYEGQGLAGKLARGALDDLRAQGGRVIATCSFIAGYIERHPEYRDLVAA